jgi:hypothetical protein
MWMNVGMPLYVLQMTRITLRIQITVYYKVITLHNHITMCRWPWTVSLSDDRHMISAVFVTRGCLSLLLVFVNSSSAQCSSVCSGEGSGVPSMGLPRDGARILLEALTSWLWSSQLRDGIMQPKAGDRFLETTPDAEQPRSTQRWTQSMVHCFPSECDVTIAYSMCSARVRLQ